MADFRRSKGLALCSWRAYPKLWPYELKREIWILTLQRAAVLDQVRRQSDVDFYDIAVKYVAAPVTPRRFFVPRRLSVAHFDGDIYDGSS